MPNNAFAANSSGRTSLPLPRVPRAYLLMLAAWALDFQSQGQGSGLAIQAVWLSLYLMGLALFIFSYRNRGVRIRGLLALLMCGSLYLAISIASGISYDQPFYPILRNGISVFVYLTIAFATAQVVVNHDFAELRKALALFCLIYAITFYAIFSVRSGGIDFSTIRYQIVGTSSIAALGYVVLFAIFRLSFVELAAMAANLLILFVAVTRTFLLSFFLQVIPLLIEFRRIINPRILLFSIAGMITISAATLYGGSQLIRWQDRIEGQGSRNTNSQTYYTRIEEWQFMYNDWTSNGSKFLFGGGLAARTSFHNVREAGGAEENMIGFGHNQHLSLLFTAGLVGGMPLLVLQLLQGVLAIRIMRSVVRAGALRNDLLFLAAWGGTIVLGNIAANFLAASFVLRGISLWYGIGTGLLLGARAQFEHARARSVMEMNRRRRAQHPA